MTYVVNIRDTPDFGTQENDLYIGRATRRFKKSKWHNPYKVGVDGTQEECIQKYWDYLIKIGLPRNVRELREKRLGCWCKPLACHGDVLVQLVQILEYLEKDGYIVTNDSTAPSNPPGGMRTIDLQ